MSAAVFLGEQLAAPGVAFRAGDTVQVDFASDRPVDPDQFFMLVGSVQEEIVSGADTISFMPLTEQTFRGVFKLSRPLAIYMGQSAAIGDVTYTVTSAKILGDTSDEKLSTGAMVGLGTAVVALGGAVVYLATRKKKRRRRRAS